MIARTEVSRASNEGTLMGYRQSGVVKGMQWWTATDERTCQFCSQMHGETFSIDEPIFKKGDTMTGKLSLLEQEQGKTPSTLKFNYEAIEHPPLHPRCRCVLLPVLK